MSFFDFLAINTLAICSKCFLYKTRKDNKPTFRKIVLKSKKKKRMWKQLYEVYAKTIISRSGDE